MFSRCVLCIRAGAGAEVAIRVARRLMPRPAHVHVVVYVEGGSAFWPIARSTPEGGVDPTRVLRELDSHLAGWTERLEGEASFRFERKRLERAARSLGAEVIVLGPTGERSRPGLLRLEDIARSCALPALWIGRDCAQAPSSRGLHVACPFEAELSRIAPLAPFLRDHTQAEDRVTFLAVGEIGAVPPLDAVAELAGIRGQVHYEQLEALATQVPERVADYVVRAEVDLLALAATSFGTWTSVAARAFGLETLQHLQAPVLVAPPLASSAWLESLDAPDAVHFEERTVRVRVERLNLIGQPAGPFLGELAAVAHGRPLRVSPGRDGVFEVALPEAPTTTLGLERAASPVSPSRGDALAAVEVAITLVRPGARPVVLLDPELAPALLGRAIAPWLAELSMGGGPVLLGVRLEKRRSIRSLRLRLANLGAPPIPIVCASAILGDAASTDRPGGFEALRMVRVARRLRAEQICVTHVFTLREGHLHQEQFDPIEARPDTAGLDHALSELTGATPIEGNEITLELANDQARRGLFQRIERAKQRIHFQTYIVRDDAMARETEQRLQAAASRGVRVRILADSLLSMHGSFGQQNPVLERLVATPGIDVQVFRPVEGVPDLSDLKQRNHRKLWVFDGDTALVTGRNLGSSYFTAFHEVALSPQTSEDGIPWLDAGAVVRGPLVTSIESSFRADWTAADGDAFELCTLAPVGTTRARWVLHDGLADAHTLDAYLAIIRGARKHLYVVNTFPLQHEALHALLAAIRRGVRLRVLVGNVRPTYGPEAVRFPGTMLGDLATQVVYGRLDALVEEGAEVYEFTVARQPGWDEEIDFVRPHVHAKLVSADGEACTIGSANLDVTAGYWESEGLLVVEDRGLATELERRLDEWIEASIPIDRDDPTWRRRSSMRTWLTKLWPSIIA